MIDSEWKTCRESLIQHAEAANDDLVWPAASWQALCQAGVTGWSVDRADSGSQCDAITLLNGYEQLAGACLTTCFILSQRESAARHLKGLAPSAWRQDLFQSLANGSSFATVGLSHLTTSRQHLQPSLKATEQGNTFLLDGTIPWVTGAAQAKHIVLGAVTDSGMQILAALPTDLPGVHVEPPLDLMALRGSLTAEVRLNKVVLPNKWLIAGPVKQVLPAGKGGAGGLETSCLALGLAGAAIDFVAGESVQRPDLQESAVNLEQDRQTVREELHRLAGAGGAAEAKSALRTVANSLVLRATQVALTASKGTGFLRNHPAQRWARQALFFLVWSCPRPTVEATLAILAPATC